jgi:hypothetical protein
LPFHFSSSKLSLAFLSLVLPKNCVIIYIDFIEFTPQFHIIFDQLG